MYIWSELSNSLYPSIEKVNTAIKKADNPVEMSRDTRDLKSLLKRITSVSPRITGHVNVRKTAITSYKWKIAGLDAKGETVKERTMRRVAKNINLILGSFWERPLFGSLAFERVPMPHDDSKGVEIALSILDQTEYDVMPDGRFFLYNSRGRREGDPTVYLYTHDGSPAVGGVLRSVIYHELLRNNLMQDWGELSRRMLGIIAGTVDVQKLMHQLGAMNADATEANNIVSNLDATLQNAGGKGYLRTLAGVEVQLKSLVEGTSGHSFEAFKNVLEADIAVAILGQANTTELPSSGGSRAALQVLNLIRSDIHYADMEAAKSLVDQYLAIDYEEAYGNGEPEYEFEFIHDEAGDVESQARKYEILARIEGVPISKRKFYADLDINLPEDDNDTLILKNSKVF